MAWVQWGALLLLLLMVAVLAMGLAQGNLAVEGGIIWSLAWGRTLLVDVYVCFALLSGWMALRERCWWRSALWIAPLLLLGSPVACLYVYLAARQSRGDARRFLLGGQPPGR